MSTSSVFVILWYPDQDSKQAPVASTGYQDEWHPLNYWIDLVLTVCRAPEIIVVCSHHVEPEEQLQTRFHDHLSRSVYAERFANSSALPDLVFVDSKARKGQIDRLNSWLSEAIGRTVGSHGNAVPSYWEVAEDMVRGWQKDKNTLPTLSIEDFSARLQAEIDKVVANEESRYKKLTQVIESDQFDLGSSVQGENRIRRTLNFLTRSGILYWNKDLFEGLIIIDQKWALDGIYAVLDREKTDAFQALVDRDGRFTREDLVELAWKDYPAYVSDQRVQDLLISYMEICGQCFEIRNAKESWWNRSLFISIEHLPSSNRLNLAESFHSRSGNLEICTRRIRSDHMYLHHWKQFLAAVGKQSKADIVYASDAILLTTKTGGNALISLSMNEHGVGGEVEVAVSGDEQVDIAADLLGKVESFLPQKKWGIDAGVGSAGSRAELEQRPVERVFVSYAWNDREKRDAINYETPVRAIKNFLDKYNSKLGQLGEKAHRVELVRDRRMERGDNIVKFMDEAGNTPKVLVVHSDKYWRSPACLYELGQVIERWAVSEDKFSSVVISININSDFKSALSQYLEYWKQFTAEGIPEFLDGALDVDTAKNDFPYYIRHFRKKIKGDLGLNIEWDAAREDEFLTAFAEYLELPPPKLLNEL